MKGYRLRVRVEIEDLEYGGGRGGLQVTEEVQLDLDGFLGVAQVLGRFHELTETVKAERARAAAEYEAVMRGQ